MLPDAVIEHVAPRHETESALLRSDGSGRLAAIRFREHHETSLEPPVALFLPKSVCEMNRRSTWSKIASHTRLAMVDRATGSGEKVVRRARIDRSTECQGETRSIRRWIGRRDCDRRDAD